jgi:hypothetical protein
VATPRLGGLVGLQLLDLPDGFAGLSLDEHQRTTAIELGSGEVVAGTLFAGNRDILGALTEPWEGHRRPDLAKGAGDSQDHEAIAISAYREE